MTVSLAGAYTELRVATVDVLLPERAPMTSIHSRPPLSGRHRRFVRGRAAVAVAMCLIAFATRPSAQRQDRELYVSVVDTAGAPVTDIETREFVVKEDGVTREVLKSTKATDPMQIALVVDNSQAAANDISNLRDSIRAFIAGLGDRDEVALISVADRPTIMVDYTTNRRALEDGIGHVFAPPGSGAKLLEAIVEVSRGIQKRNPDRPVIVLVTTEGPEFSDLHEKYVLDALEKSGAAMHAVILTSPDADISSDRARTRSIVLNRGTEASGGLKDPILTSQNLPARLGQIAAEISNQYRVTYSRPESLIPPEKIQVGVTREKLSARGTPVRAAPGGR